MKPYPPLREADAWSSQQIEVPIELRFTAELRHDEKLNIWVSRSRDLDLYTQGTTREEALEAINSAVRMWVTACVRRGILDREMERLGITKVDARPSDADVLEQRRRLMRRLEIEYLERAALGGDLTSPAHWPTEVRVMFEMLVDKGIIC